MATTKKGIYYQNDYEAVGDIIEDMKKMAESIDEIIENRAEGQNGLSAYEIAVKSGFEGTEQEWLNSLKATYDDTEIQNKIIEIENVVEGISSDIVNINKKINKLKDQHIYGIKRNIESSNSAWERIEDSVGLVANATHDGTEVKNDFDSLYPWSDIKTYNYNATTNQITALIGEPTFQFDGTNGEVMTRFPEFWYKREQKTEEGNTYEYIYIANFEAEGFVKSEQFSLSRYIASGNSSKIGSASGKNPLGFEIPDNFRNYAKALGNGWGLLDIWSWSVLQILYLVEYADYNIQDKIGQGVINKSSVNISGGCDSLGMKSGCLGNDGTYSMIYRGVEDIYGNIWQFCDGININNCQAYVCNNQENYACNVFSELYPMLGYKNSTISGQYVKKVGYDANNPSIQLPIEGGGSSDTYMTDCYWCVAAADVGRVVWLGGAHSDGAYCGLWHYACGDTYTSASHLRACRLFLNQ